MEKYTRGAITTIYTDPITKRNPEGEARLIRRIRRDEGDGLEMWEVRFLNEPVYTYPRTISNRPAPSEGEYIIPRPEALEAHREQS